MSSFIVFDSQNQRWMLLRETRVAEKLQREHKERLVGGRGREVGALALIITAIVITPLAHFGLDISAYAPTCAFMSIFSCTFCLYGMITRSYAKQNTAKAIENYVKEYGWADFEPTQPNPGLPCFVVNYKDPSIV